MLGAAWVSMWFFLNLYLQQVLGASAFAAGAALLPMTGLGRARHDRAGTATAGAVRREGADRQRPPAAGRPDWRGSPSSARTAPTRSMSCPRRCWPRSACRWRSCRRSAPPSTRRRRRRPAWRPAWSAPATRSAPRSGSPCSRRSSTASPGTDATPVELTQGYSAAFIGAAILALLGSDHHGDRHEEAPGLGHASPRTPVSA
jgi:hypothetical protein